MQIQNVRAYQHAVCTRKPSALRATAAVGEWPQFVAAAGPKNRSKAGKKRFGFDPICRGRTLIDFGAGEFFCRKKLCFVASAFAAFNIITGPSVTPRSLARSGT